MPDALNKIYKVNRLHLQNPCLNLKNYLLTCLKKNN